MSDDLTLLIDAARAAGKIALHHAHAGVTATDKADGAGPVTEADLEVDRMLRAELLAAHPDHGWLSEETADTPARLDAARQFIVDPIDGTRAFIEGSRDWAHSLALAEGGRIVAAVVYLPQREALYAATEGGGATLNGAPIAPSAVTDTEAAEVLTARPTLDPVHWCGGRVPGFRRAFRSSLAWRLCLVAEGRFDAMMTLRPAWEWDVAAGTLIAAEAGAMVTDGTGGALSFNNPHPQVPGVIAAGPALHAGLVSRLA